MGLIPAPPAATRACAWTPLAVSGLPPRTAQSGLGVTTLRPTSGAAVFSPLSTSERSATSPYDSRTRAGLGCNSRWLLARLAIAPPERTAAVAAGRTGEAVGRTGVRRRGGAEGLAGR